MTLDQYYAKVRELERRGFSPIHARLTALQDFGVVRENCPEPGYWHYEIVKPDEFPNDMKHNYPAARGGYFYRPSNEFRSHIVYC